MRLGSTWSARKVEYWGDVVRLEVGKMVDVALRVKGV